MLQSLLSGLTVIISYVPKIIGALLILLIGYVIARLLRALIVKVLQKLKLDEHMTAGHGGDYVQRFSPRGSPSRFVAMVVFWLLMLFVLSSAVGTLGIPALTGFMGIVLGYLPRVLAALLILMAAALVAGAVKGLVQRGMGDTPASRIASTAAPALVMAIAVFMMLTELQIAPVIVTVTYVALIGSLALGAAIAFGLGGREAAANAINAGYRRAQQQSGQQEADQREAGAAGTEEGREPIPGQQRRAEEDTGTRAPGSRGW